MRVSLGRESLKLKRRGGVCVSNLALGGPNLRHNVIKEMSKDFRHAQARGKLHGNCFNPLYNVQEAWGFESVKNA